MMVKKEQTKWYETLSVSVIKALAIAGMIAGLINENWIGFLLSAIFYSLLDYIQGEFLICQK